jgi:chemotaxis protein MotA
MTGYAIGAAALAVAWQAGAAPSGLWHPPALLGLALAALAFMLTQLDTADLAAARRPRPPAEDEDAVVRRLVELATRHRLAGQRGLEAETLLARGDVERLGLTLVVDGSRPSEVETALRATARRLADSELAACRLWRRVASALVNGGVLTTLTAAVRVLLNAPAAGPSPAALGGALIASVAGLALALLLAQPQASVRRQDAERAARCRELWIEGLTAIAGGIHPRRLASWLNGVDPLPDQPWRRAA